MRLTALMEPRSESSLRRTNYQHNHNVGYGLTHFNSTVNTMRNGAHEN